MNWLIASVLLGASGCSLIYNPSDLPPAPGDALPDLPPDEPVIDADPALLVLDPIVQGPLLEGQGVGGSPPGVLSVSGQNLIEGATVTITSANPDVVIDIVQVQVAVTHHSIGVLVAAHVAPTLAETVGLIDLDVTVTQPEPFTAVSQTVQWKFKPLDTYTATGTNIDPPPAGKIFSDATLTGPLTFKGGDGSSRVIVRAVSSITVTGTVSASAGTLSGGVLVGKLAGAGGCTGGDGGTEGTCFGKGGPGGNGGGGGGGFNGPGTAGNMGGGAGNQCGAQELPSFTIAGNANENKGGSGGGGSGGVGNGGEGGGSGGTIELTAGGDLVLAGATITANGAQGQDAQGAALSSGGGGGAGGVLLLRSGGTLTPPTDAQAKGGPAGGSTLGGKVGGKGAPGRIRADSTVDVAVPNANYTGPMIVRPSSLIVRQALTLFDLHAKDGDDFSVASKEPDGTVDTLPITAFSAGQKSAPLLAPGVNRVCTIVKDAMLSTAEGTNCIEVVYVP